VTVTNTNKLKSDINRRTEIKSIHVILILTFQRLKARTNVALRYGLPAAQLHTHCGMLTVALPAAQLHTHCGMLTVALPAAQLHTHCGMLTVETRSDII
jgi:hypothetical protein